MNKEVKDKWLQCAFSSIDEDNITDARKQRLKDEVYDFIETVDEISGDADVPTWEMDSSEWYLEDMVYEFFDHYHGDTLKYDHGMGYTKSKRDYFFNQLYSVLGWSLDEVTGVNDL